MPPHPAGRRVLQTNTYKRTRPARRSATSPHDLSLARPFPYAPRFPAPSPSRAARTAHGIGWAAAWRSLGLSAPRLSDVRRLDCLSLINYSSFINNAVYEQQQQQQQQLGQHSRIPHTRSLFIGAVSIATCSQSVAHR
jgi:hypothetical protein